jgi:hypothetical protein
MSREVRGTSVGSAAEGADRYADFVGALDVSADNMTPDSAGTASSPRGASPEWHGGLAVALRPELCDAVFADKAKALQEGSVEDVLEWTEAGREGSLAVAAVLAGGLVTSLPARSAEAAATRGRRRLPGLGNARA